MRKIELEEYATRENIPVPLGKTAKKKDLMQELEFNYAMKDDNYIYPTTHDFVETAGSMLKLIGYTPEHGVAFRYKNLETNYALGLESKERYVSFPTLDFYPYTREGDLVAQLFLYDKAVLQFNKMPSGIVMLANENNRDFEGRTFNQNILKNPQRVFLKNVLGDTRMKQFSKKELVERINRTE